MKTHRLLILPVAAVLLAGTAPHAHAGKTPPTAKKPQTTEQSATSKRPKRRAATRTSQYATSMSRARELANRGLRARTGGNRPPADNQGKRPSRDTRRDASTWTKVRDARRDAGTFDPANPPTPDRDTRRDAGAFQPVSSPPRSILKQPGQTKQTKGSGRKVTFGKLPKYKK